MRSVSTWREASESRTDDLNRVPPLPHRHDVLRLAQRQAVVSMVVVVSQYFES